jgi:uncharacterized membrane protein
MNENSGDTSMNTLLNAGGAVALALALLLCAATPAGAHEAHQQKAEESAGAHEEAPLTESHVAAESKPHDHANHGQTEDDHAIVSDETPQAESNVPKPLAWLGKFHPPLTHFPIALLTAAALAELLFMRTQKAGYRQAVLFTVRLGAAAALLAAPLGWFFAGFHLVDEEWVMTAHRWAGTAMALLAVVLLALLERGELTETRQSRFRLALFSAAGLVGATGFLGGALLYGLDHYAW